MEKYGLIGKNISYSFSKKYFDDKLKREHIVDSEFDIYDIDGIAKVKNLLDDPQVKGLCVTIPYKQVVIPYLDSLDDEAAGIGAVNCIRIFADRTARGYNTDAFGFRKSLVPFLESHHTRALILGTGGASKAVAYVLKSLGIDFVFVSRKPVQGQLSYEFIRSNPHIVSQYPLIVNCSPVGTFPNVNDAPDLPYDAMNEKNLLYDLVYNPAETAFMKKGGARGASVTNGMTMLVLQAERNWEIWNSPVE